MKLISKRHFQKYCINLNGFLQRISQRISTNVFNKVFIFLLSLSLNFSNISFNCLADELENKSAVSNNQSLLKRNIELPLSSELRGETNPTNELAEESSVLEKNDFSKITIQKNNLSNSSEKSNDLNDSIIGDIEKPYLIKGQTSSFNSLGRTPLKLEEIFQRIDNFHPSLHSTEQNRRLAEADIMGAKSAFIPKFLSRGLMEDLYDAKGKKKNAFTYSGELYWQTPFGAEIMTFGRTTTKSILDQDGLSNINSKSVLDSVTKYKLDGFTSSELSLAIRIPLLRDLLIDPQRADLKRAKLQTPLAEAEILKKRADLFAKAAEKYWTWIGAGFQYRVAEKLLDLAEIRGGGTKERVELGAAPPIDLIEVNAQIQSRKENLIKAERKLEKEAIALSTYLWEEDFGFITPTKDNLPDKLPNPINLPQELWEAHLEASKQRPELKILEIERKQENINLRLARNDMLPTINFEVLPTQDLDNGDRTNIRGSLNLEVPLYPLKAKSQILKTQAKIQKNNLNQTDLKAVFVNEVRDAISNIQTTKERIEYAKASYEGYEALAEGEETRFQFGNSNLFLLNAREVSAADAEMKLIEALIENQIAVAEYRYAIGEWSIPGFDSTWYELATQNATNRNKSSQENVE